MTADLETALAEAMDLNANGETWRCTGDAIRCHDGHGCECEMHGTPKPNLEGAALNLIRQHGDEIAGLVQDAERPRREVTAARDWLATRASIRTGWDALAFLACGALCVGLFLMALFPREVYAALMGVIS